MQAGSGADGRRRALVASLVAFGCSTVALLAIVWTWIRHYVNEDQALLWAAGDSWRHGSPRQPDFWGQQYGTTLEAIPAAILRSVGIGYQTGLPLTIVACNLATWGVLGWAAWRRGLRGAAVAAFGAVALLGPGHLVLAAAYNTAVGRLLAAIAAAMVLHGPSTARRVAATVLPASLAVVFDNSTLIVVAPVLLALALAILRDRARRERLAQRTSLALVALGLVPAVAFAALSRWWYRAHPADVVHPAPSFEPSLARLRDNLTHPTRHFAVLEPELLPSLVVPAAIVLVIVVVGLVRRRWWPLAGLALVIAVTCTVLSVPRANDYLDTAYYPAGRVVLALPIGVWFIAAWMSSSSAPTADRRGLQQWAAVAVCALCVLSTAVRAGRWDTEVVQLRDRAVASPLYPLTEAGELGRLCDRTLAEASATGASFAVFELRTPAYACAGLHSSLRTVYPPYERRTWLLRDFLRASEPDFLFVGELGPCPQPITCTTLSTQIALVTRPPGMTPAEALAALGVVIRPPFGP